MGMKICTACLETKCFEAFGKGNDKNGLRHVCKTCRKAEYVAEKPEALRRAKAWQAANRPRHYATTRAWKESNRDRMMVTQKVRFETRMATCPIDYLLQGTKSRASQRARGNPNDLRAVFTIALSDVQDAPSCPDCLVPFTPQGLDDKGRRKPHVRSLDRADSSKGYIPGNVHVICWHCNRAKGDDSLARVQHLHDTCTPSGMITCHGIQQPKPTLARRIERMKKALTLDGRAVHSEKLTRSATWALDEYATTLEKLHG